ncbi:MAG: YesL family protein [Acetatifactor sp.]
MKFFSLDSPLMQALNKMADLLWLNVLAILCCIPVVTVGASMTALHYMLLKIVRDEETYVTRGFFKSFKNNFRQATVIWLIQLVVTLVLVGDFYIMYKSETEFHIVFQVLLMIVAVLVVLTSTFVYPVLAKFDNSIFRTIKNALYVSILQLPKAIAMIIMSALPIVLVAIAPSLVPIMLMFGLSIPAYLFAKLYNKFFQKLEDKVNERNAPEKTDEEENGEDERIFKDELDETLTAGSQEQ